MMKKLLSNMFSLEIKLKLDSTLLYSTKHLGSADAYLEYFDERIHYAKVMSISGKPAVIESKSELEAFIESQLRAEAWIRKASVEFLNMSDVNQIEKAVDPKHYKGYVDDMQWIHVMSKLPTMSDPKCFSAALELQVRKYLDRNGQKDNSLQELKKAAFYLLYLIKYLENDNKGVDPQIVQDALK